MHPLPAAQATVASLHALVLGQDPTSPDERLVIDAISALQHWAVPDQRPVPTRLRVRPSIPLLMRIKSPSYEATVIVNRRKVRSSRGIRSANREIRIGQGTSRSQEGKPSSATGGVVEDASQLHSSSNSGGKVVNLSDLSTEPPEGWPKLARLSSPVLEHESEILESPKDINKDDTRSELSAPANRPKQIGDPQSPVINGQSPKPGSREKPRLKRKNATSSTKRVAKRRRVSPRVCRKVGIAARGKPDSGSTDASPESDEDIDSPADSPGMNEQGRTIEFCTHRATVGKTSKKKRKSAVPKRRRPTPIDENPGPPFISDSAKELSDGTNDFVESPPPSFDTESPEGVPSAKPVQIDGNAESPAISVTQKSKEQDTGDYSDKNVGPSNSLGSVVVGSPSYDGRSVDMGFDRTGAEQDGVHRRPSSFVWNEGNVESIEEPPSFDQSVSQLDRIEETDKMLQSEPHLSPKLSQRSKSLRDSEKLNVKPQAERKGPPVDSIVTSGALRPPSIYLKSPDKAVLRESKSLSTTTAPPRLAKSGNPLNLQVSTPLASSRNAPVSGRQNANRHLPSRTSPVSPDELPEDSARHTEAEQKANYISPSEGSIDEMIVCIASFTKDIESELAHELVMRLGGEIVSDLDGPQPECVVAPVDSKTEETLNSEMVILFALASRVPIVSLRWLTQCFSSGCWVNSKDFETPSSRLRPTLGVFTGVAAAFEEAFSRKNARKQCRRYLDDVSKLIVLAGGVVIEKSKIVGVVRNDSSIRLHIQVAYDFDDGTMDPAPQVVPGGRIPLRVVNRSWISACLFSGQCPPP